MLSNSELIYRTRYYKRGKWLAISVVANILAFAALAVEAIRCAVDAG